VVGLPKEVKGYSTGPGRHLAQLALKRELGRGHAFYCDGSCKRYAVSSLPAGVAQFGSSSQLQLLVYSKKTLSAKSHGELALMVPQIF
jgi:hypothetical protein